MNPEPQSTQVTVRSWKLMGPPSDLKILARSLYVAECLELIEDLGVELHPRLRPGRGDPLPALLEGPHQGTGPPVLRPRAVRRLARIAVQQEQTRKLSLEEDQLRILRAQHLHPMAQGRIDLSPSDVGAKLGVHGVERGRIAAGPERAHRAPLNSLGRSDPKQVQDA